MSCHSTACMFERRLQWAGAACKYRSQGVAARQTDSNYHRHLQLAPPVPRHPALLRRSDSMRRYQRIPPPLPRGQLPLGSLLFLHISAVDLSQHHQGQIPDALPSWNRIMEVGARSGELRGGGTCNQACVADPDFRVSLINKHPEILHDELKMKRRHKNRASNVITLICCKPPLYRATGIGRPS